MEEKIKKLIYLYEIEIMKCKKQEKKSSIYGNYTEAIQMNFAATMNQLFIRDLKAILRQQK